MFLLLHRTAWEDNGVSGSPLSGTSGVRLPWPFPLGARGQRALLMPPPPESGLRGVTELLAGGVTAQHLVSSDSTPGCQFLLGGFSEN